MTVGEIAMTDIQIEEIVMTVEMVAEGTAMTAGKAMTAETMTIPEV